jgi:hypothetical protein
MVKEFYNNPIQISNDLVVTGQISGQELKIEGNINSNGNLNLSKNLTVGGSIFINGSAANINTTNLILSDALIYLANKNDITDLVDIGFVGAFNNEIDQNGFYQHTGLVRSVSDKKWVLFKGLTSEPLTATNINLNDNTFQIDTLKANIEGTLTGNVTGNISGNAESVTNGVYTNQSYSNPNWINSLDFSKITNSNASNWDQVYSVVQTNSSTEWKNKPEWDSTYTTFQSFSSIDSRLSDSRPIIFYPKNIEAFYPGDPTSLIYTATGFSNNRPTYKSYDGNYIIEYVINKDYSLYGEPNFTGWVDRDDVEGGVVWALIRTNTLDVTKIDGDWKFNSFPSGIYPISAFGPETILELTYSDIGAAPSDVYTTVQTNSSTEWKNKAEWDQVYSVVQTNSSTEWKNKAEWDQVYSVVQTNSSTEWKNKAEWDQVYSVVQTNSSTDWKSSIVTTFNDLTALKQSNQLIVGQTYIISDFILKWWNQSLYNLIVLDSEVIEPLIVTALSTNKISHEAKSALHPEDIVYYDIDATTSYTWGELNTNISIPNFKGWIYRRIDTKKNIDIGWDWRYITTNCYKIDMSGIEEFDDEKTYNLYDVVKFSNKIYFSVVDSNLNLIGDIPFWQPLTPYDEGTMVFPYADGTTVAPIWNILKSDGNSLFSLIPLLTSYQVSTFVNTFTPIGTSLKIPLDYSNVENIKIKSGYQNVIYNFAKNNIIETNFILNIIGFSMQNNNIHSNFVGNVIGAEFELNNIQSNFINNIIGSNFLYNTVGSDFSGNIMSGQSCYSNNFCENVRNNIISSFFQSNDIRHPLQRNLIGNNFQNNKVNTVIENLNLKIATHLYEIYNTTIFKNANNDTRLSYYNSTDQLIVTDINN